MEANEVQNTEEQASQNIENQAATTGTTSAEGADPAAASEGGEEHPHHHHTSAQVAASLAHSAVNHVKPHHNSHLDL